MEFLAKAILKYLEINKAKLLFIFDGIDNIDYYLDREKYHIFLNDLIRHFSLGLEKAAINNAKILVTLRDETMAHIYGKAATFGKPEVFRIKSPSINDIIAKKIPIAFNEKTSYFKKYRQEANYDFTRDDYYNKKGLTRIHFDSEFNKFATVLPAELCKEAKSIYRSFPANPDDILLYIFNENVRAFINNLLNSFKYKILFEAKKKLLDREYILLEGMFLDGELYIDSSDTRKRSESFINIFYYSDSERSHYWHGLCGLRVLQVLQRGSSEKESIIDLLSKLFNYDPLIIEQFIQRFVGDGLIVPVGELGKETVIYSITNKGEFLIKYPFLDINYLYFLALDTPLLMELVQNPANIKIHKKFWANYTECCVKTVITMIRHIKAKQRNEFNMLGEKMKKKEYSTTLCKYYRSLTFTFDGIIEQIGLMLQISESDDPRSPGNPLKERIKRDIEELSEDGDPVSIEE